MTAQAPEVSGGGRDGVRIELAGRLAGPSLIGGQIVRMPDVKPRGFADPHLGAMGIHPDPNRSNRSEALKKGDRLVGECRERHPWRMPIPNDIEPGAVAYHQGSRLWTDGLRRRHQLERLVFEQGAEMTGAVPGKTPSDDERDAQR